MRGKEDGVRNPLTKAVESAPINSTIIQRQPNSTLSNSITPIPAINVPKKKRAVTPALPTKIKSKYFIAPSKKLGQVKISSKLNKSFYISVLHDHGYLPNAKYNKMHYNIREIYSKPMNRNIADNIEGNPVDSRSLSTLKDDILVDGEVINAYFNLINKQNIFKIFILDTYAFAIQKSF